MSLVRKLVSIRGDQEEWIEAQKFGFNLSLFVRERLDQHIKEHRKDGE
jgi:hypothetical protein